MDLAAKSLAGALIVAAIQLLASSRHYYVAGLVPLFPTFALMAHYTVGVERGPAHVRATVVFGMWAVLPYLVYLSTMYALVSRTRLSVAMGIATAAWFVSGGVLVFLWRHVAVR